MRPAGANDRFRPCQFPASDGIALHRRGRDDLAIDWFAQAIRQNPDVADYFSNLATVLVNRGRIDEAIKSLDRALMLKPDWAELWYRMGLLLEQQGRTAEAGLCFDRALEAVRLSRSRQCGGARPFQRRSL